MSCLNEFLNTRLLKQGMNKLLKIIRQVFFDDSALGWGFTTIDNLVKIVLSVYGTKNSNLTK